MTWELCLKTGSLPYHQLFNFGYYCTFSFLMASGTWFWCSIFFSRGITGLSLGLSQFRFVLLLFDLPMVQSTPGFQLLVVVFGWVHVLVWVRWNTQTRSSVGDPPVMKSGGGSILGSEALASLTSSEDRAYKFSQTGVCHSTFESLHLGRSSQSIASGFLRFWDPLNFKKDRKFVEITVFLLDEKLS
ncbi:hypothetical protein YC2023_072525 [Brassica napus]